LIIMMPFQDMLIGNPMAPALHGGIAGAFLDSAAMILLIGASTGKGHGLSGKEVARLVCVALAEAKGPGTGGRQHHCRFHPPGH
jgi:hypothetical protein